jgi:hypothetical protein
MEYATISYQTGEQAGWRLSDQVIVRDAVPLLDRLTAEGWKLIIIGNTCQLARPKQRSVWPVST